MTVTTDSRRRAPRLALAALAGTMVLAGCGGPIFGGNPFRGDVSEDRLPEGFGELDPIGSDRDDEDSFFDLFTNVDDPNTTVEVNRFIWQAAQEVLNFMPVQAVDPFSGTIVYGFGTPPGGSRAYRATVYITDPALDARSLNVAMQSRGGPVPAATQRAVEDAILTRARQIRVATGAL